MWQKFLYSVFFIIIAGVCTQVYAKTVEVSALSPISTANPSESVSVKILEPVELQQGQIIEAGSTLTGQLVDVKSPKRLKRDAGFSIKPKSYVSLDGVKHDLNLNIKASYTKPLDKGEVAKNAALGVGNYFVKGLSMGVAAVQGAVKNEEGGRVKSSVVSAYEASPLSYAEKGEDLDIQSGQHFYLKFPDVKADKNKSDDGEIKGQNYSFTIEKE